MISPTNPLILIGCGNMGRALAEGWCASLLKAGSLIVIDTDTSKASALHAPFDVPFYPSLDALPKSITPAAICLATKPNHLAEVLATIRDLFPESQPLIFSVAAGKSLDFYVSHLWPDAKLIRVMPNTPSMVGQGMSVCIKTASVNDDEQQSIDALLAAVGDVAWIEDESQMDAVTAISGSGPAYIFYIMECLIDAGKNAGLDASLATRLAVQTVLGAATLAKGSDSTISQLRTNVTSPNGTTAAALQVLMEAGSSDLHSILNNAVQAARARSIELSTDA